MDFSLSKEQVELRQRALDAAPEFANRNNESAFCSSGAWLKCAQGGWAGLCLPSAYGGGGYGALDSVLAFEALGQHGADRGALFATGAHLFGCAKAVELFASSEARNDWLPELAAGRAVGALALTEETGGSELNCNMTSLEENERTGQLVLSGAKSYITNGICADLYVVLAREPSAKPPMNLTAVLVPSNSINVRSAKMVGGMGLAATDMACVSFDGCEISPGEILGRRRGGLGVVLAVMQWERSCILAGALGALSRDLKRVTRALSERRGASGPLIANQAVSHRLVNVRQRIEIARWMMLRAAWELDHKGDQILFPALSKLTVSETLLECAIELQTLMGGAGWANAFDLGQSVQDAVAMITTSGTSDIQRNLIAKRLELS